MTPVQARRKFLRSAGLATASLLVGCSQIADSTGAESGETATDFTAKTRNRAKNLGRTVRRSVVRIVDGDTGGTGWIVEDGYVLTNSHVVRGSEVVDIETFGGRTASATRVGFHEDFFPDIALLEADFETPPPLPMMTNALPSNGDEVLAVGHPKTVGDWVISLGRYDSYNPRADWILATIPTGDGDSGSPLLTMDGYVVGCINGTTPNAVGPERSNRSEAVYTAYPKRVTMATATPAKTISKWLSEWR
ncbi:S1 family peptidase [Haladaptatus caseinilyticus]|uniref:S1 family peptidase n=1 Tax=Haladaptatus caseinilyticus TaxID=2993314 RepID=UPI00224A4945|nr:trypsin-like peptidase domain-containing protein [Haladaptatus caseinilyticus]